MSLGEDLCDQLLAHVETRMKLKRGSKVKFSLFILAKEQKTFIHMERVGSMYKGMCMDMLSIKHCKSGVRGGG